MLHPLCVVLIYDFVELSFLIQVHLNNKTLIVLDHHGVQILLNELRQLIVFLGLNNIVFHGLVLLLRQVLLVSPIDVDVARVVARFVHH